MQNAGTMKPLLWRGLNELKKNILDNNKGFLNLCFMNKLKWIKTEWNQAIFS